MKALHSSNLFRTIAFPAFLIGMLLVVGCSSLNSYIQKHASFMSSDEFAIPPESSLTEIVAHLNRTSHQVSSWQCTDAQVQMSGLGAALRFPTMMAVEEPSRMRFVVSNGLDGQHEVDFGANNERLWLWSRPRGKDAKNVYTVSHTELNKMNDALPFPVDLNWMMQALSVAEYDASQLTLERVSNVPHLVNLVAIERQPGTPRLKRVTEVNLKDGRVSAHRLFGPDGKIVAEAELKEYRKTPINDVYLPHKLVVFWPDAKKRFTISLNQLEVNPQTISADLWDVPEYRDCPRREITAAHFRRPRHSLQYPTANASSLGQHPRMVTEYEFDSQNNVKTEHQIQNESVKSPGRISLSFEPGVPAESVQQQSLNQTTPEWAGGLGEGYAEDFNVSPEAEQPSGYSEEAWPASSGRLHQEPELSPWQ